MDTNKLKELADRATPGPWVVDAQQSGAVFNIESESGDRCIAMSQENPAPTRLEMNEQRKGNAEYIAAANPAAVLDLIAEVERLRKAEALQKQVNEHYKTWFRECIDEPFDAWLKDDATHWIGEQDAAFQAWQYLHENKIWLMKERIEEHEQERDRLKAENEALRKIISECATACGAGCHPECTLEFMAMLPDEIASVVGKRARNAAIGAVVWQFIDRMTDVCEQDPAERILEQFVAAVRPAIDAALEGGGK